MACMQRKSAALVSRTVEKLGLWKPNGAVKWHRQAGARLNDLEINDNAEIYNASFCYSAAGSVCAINDKSSSLKADTAIASPSGGDKVRKGWCNQLQLARQAFQLSAYKKYVQAFGEAHTHGLQCRGFAASAPGGARSPDFGTLQSEDVEYFRTTLGTSGVITDEDALAVANTDWMNKYHGKSKLLLRPKTSEQVRCHLLP
jgi:hypothetical protein